MEQPLRTESLAQGFNCRLYTCGRGSTQGILQAVASFIQIGTTHRISLEIGVAIEVSASVKRYTRGSISKALLVV
jgi:hypothetical protein